MKPYKRRIILALLCIALSQVAVSLIPLVLKEVVDAIKVSLDEGLEDGIAQEIRNYAFVILGLAAVQMVLQMVMRWYLNGMARHAENDIREAYFRHLLKLSMGYFHTVPTGDLMSRVTNDINSVRMFMSFGVRMLTDSTLTVTMSFAIMCSIDWELAVCSLLPMPVLVLTMNRAAGKINEYFREVQEQFAAISARVQENLSGIRVVKAFVQRSGEMAAFDVLNRGYLDKSRKLILIYSLIRPIGFLISGASLAMILWLGGHRVMEGVLTLGEFVAFNAYLTRLVFPMILLGWMIDRYERGRASMARLDEILSVSPEIEDADQVQQVKEITGEIEFRNLTFSFGETPVLKQINLRIPAGSTLAIVGRVGSGKTVLSRLIPRLIQAEPGMVLIDGVPVEEIPLQTLRSAIGYVPQDTFLFSDSIRENVAFGVTDATDVAVHEALEVSQLESDLDDLPDGLETVVGERGVTLSGGQKQRTALARAVIRKPDILILDDALASVDTHTEEAILHGLRGIMADRTTVLISHRISTVQGADQIVVLDEGAVAELGTHESLLKSNGIYAEMFKRQQLSQELDQI